MKKNIAIISGGYSSEKVVSVKSAKEIAELIDKEKYNIFQVFIDNRQWLLRSETGEDLGAIDKNDFSVMVQGEKICFDCAFIAIHGSPGEDGKLQAYFELTGIPYTSGNILSSALTFNKYMCNNFLKSAGIDIARSVLIRKNDPYSADMIQEEVGLPCFIKPNNSGSSFGISKVNKKDQIEEALEKALLEDDEVIVEQFIKGRELTCAMLKTSEHEIVFPITEIISKNDFFDYEAKYNAELADEITPADITDKIEKKCTDITRKIYSLLNCRGIVRIDYILFGSELYFLEVNTVPGMTRESIFPKQIKASNYTITEVYTMVIEEALKKV